MNLRARRDIWRGLKEVREEENNVAISQKKKKTYVKHYLERFLPVLLAVWGILGELYD
jgi:hypothetical protein